MIFAQKSSGTYTLSSIKMPGAQLWPSQWSAQSDIYERLDVVLDPVTRPPVGTAKATNWETPATPVVHIHGPKDKIKTRFRMLKRLPANHDGEGASAPDWNTIDMAMAFVDSMTHHPGFLATLDDDGCAVIEFEDRAIGFFGDVTFRPDGSIECYRRKAGLPSLEFQGKLSSPEVQQFLEAEFQIVF